MLTIPGLANITELVLDRMPQIAGKLPTFKGSVKKESPVLQQSFLPCSDKIA